MPARNSAIVALAIGVLSGGTQAFAQAQNWTEQGPGPMLMTSNTVLPPMNPAAGAINAIVPSPSSPDVIFVGTVSGGVWKTSNATAESPIWEPLTDKQLPELAIRSLAMSPVNPNTLFAGTGSTSSFGRFQGTLGIGVARSTDGGTTWTVLNSDTTGEAIFTGRTITSIVPTTLNGGATVLAATWEGTKVWRSLDEGATWTDLTTNLPDLTRLVTTIEVFHPSGATTSTLFAGGFGVFDLPFASSEPIGEWAPVTGPPPDNNTIPPALVLDLHYDYTNNVLVAGTLGRGAWTYAAPAPATASIGGTSGLSLAGPAATNPWPAPPSSANPPAPIR